MTYTLEYKPCGPDCDHVHIMKDGLHVGTSTVEEINQPIQQGDDVNLIHAKITRGAE